MADPTPRISKPVDVSEALWKVESQTFVADKLVEFAPATAPCLAPARSAGG